MNFLFLRVVGFFGRVGMFPTLDMLLLGLEILKRKP